MKRLSLLLAVVMCILFVNSAMADVIKHRVKQGENLTKISKMYKGSTIEGIARENKLESIHKIYKNQILTITTGNDAIRGVAKKSKVLYREKKVEIEEEFRYSEISEEVHMKMGKRVSSREYEFKSWEKDEILYDENGGAVKREYRSSTLTKEYSVIVKDIKYTKVYVYIQKKFYWRKPEKVVEENVVDCQKEEVRCVDDMYEETVKAEKEEVKKVIVRNSGEEKIAAHFESGEFHNRVSYYYGDINRRTDFSIAGGVVLRRGHTYWVHMRGALYPIKKVLPDGELYFGPEVDFTAWRGKANDGYSYGGYKVIGRLALKRYNDVEGYNWRIAAGFGSEKHYGRGDGGRYRQTEKYKIISLSFDISFWENSRDGFLDDTSFWADIDIPISKRGHRSYDGKKINGDPQFYSLRVSVGGQKVVYRNDWVKVFAQLEASAEFPTKQYIVNASLGISDVNDIFEARVGPTVDVREGHVGFQAGARINISNLIEHLVHNHRESQVEKINQSDALDNIEVYEGTGGVAF